MPQVFKIGSYWVYFWPTKMIRWNPFMFMFHRVLQQQRAKIWIDAGREMLICATTIPTFRPVFCETLWPSSKHEAMK